MTCQSPIGNPSISLRGTVSFNYYLNIVPIVMSFCQFQTSTMSKQDSAALGIVSDVMALSKTAWWS